MASEINYFVEDKVDTILVRNSVHGYQELSKRRSPKGTCVTVFQKGIGHQEIPIDMFDELKPDYIFPGSSIK